MSDDELIPTSDIDEMEESLAATDTDRYVQEAVAAAKRNLAILWADPHREREEVRRVGGGEPPRKRFKASYEDGEFGTPGPSTARLSASPFASSFRRSETSPITVVRDAQPSLASPTARTTPSPPSHTVDTLPLDQARPHSPITPPPPATREPSADPLLLFTQQSSPPPAARSITPSKKGLYPSEPTTPPPVPFQSQSQSQSPSSPLTPLHSPNPPSPSPARSHGSHHSSPFHSHPTPPPNPSPIPPSNPDPDPASTTTTNLADHSLAQELQTAEHHSRYTLRTRNLRQQRPYKFDEALYERQLRGVPEAIVKFRNIPGEHHHRRGEHGREGSHPRADDDDGEVDPSVLETQESEGERRRRRRRSESGQRRLHEDESGTHAPAHDPRRRSSPVNNGGADTDSPGASHRPPKPKPKPKPKELEWKPAVFGEVFSSSSDSDSNSEAGHAKVVEERPTKKRVKPFPMRRYGREKEKDRAGAGSVGRDGEDKGDEKEKEDDEVPRRRRMVFSDSEKEADHNVRRRSVSLSVHRRSVSRMVLSDSEDEGRRARRDGSLAPGQDFDIWGAEEQDVDADDRGGWDDPLGGLDDPLGGLDEPRASAPPTSSSVGRVSDIDGDGEDNYIASQAASSVDEGHSNDSDSDEMDMDRRRLKVLQRMMPRVMIQKELAKTRSAHNSHRKHKVSTQADTSTAVGVVRTKRGTGVGLPVEVRGDSESESSDEEEEKEGGARYYEQRTLDVHVGHRRTRSPSYLPLPRNSPLLLSSSDLDSSSDVGEEQSIHEEISDDEVTQWNARPDEWRLSRPHSNKERVKEPSLIDWMLGGTRTRRHNSSSGSKRRVRGSGGRGEGGGGGGEGRPRLARSGISVVFGGGGGAGKKRQSRLLGGQGHHRTGHGHSVSERQAGRHSHSFSNHHHGESGPSRSLSTHSHADPPPTNDHAHIHAHAIPSATALDLQKAHAKAKQHKRKLAAANGAYTFDGGGRLTSGRRAEFVSVDVEDEDGGFSSNSKFVKNYRKRKRDASPTVQPVKQRTTLNDYFGEHSPSPSPPVLDLTHDADTDMEPLHREEEGRRTRVRRRVEVDAGVRPLPVSVSFGLDTYVGRGRLRELLGTRSPPQLPLQPEQPEQPLQPPHSPPAATLLPPPPFYIDGFVLSHTMSISDFAHAIPEKVSALIPHIPLPLSPAMVKTASRDHRRAVPPLVPLPLFDMSALHVVRIASFFGRRSGLLVRVPGECLMKRGSLRLLRAMGCLHRLALDIRWTAVEVAFRMRFDCGEEDGARRFADHVKGFVEHLWLCDLRDLWPVTEAPPVGLLAYRSPAT
ncbi:hypothetical protein BC629DRAFT_1587055 [Irpex lacteus]|nr:hypothetical protein BC629DRAFT_1587055 [Irpex lacteus]